MSIQHHSSDNEAQKRLMDEIFGRAKLKWPNGQIAPDDHGETAFAIAADPRHNVIRIHFSKPMTWLGLDKTAAVKLRDMLTEKIAEISDAP